MRNCWLADMRAGSDLWVWRVAAVAIWTVDPTINDAARMDSNVFRMVASFKMFAIDQTWTLREQLLLADAHRLSEI